MAGRRRLPEYYHQLAAQKGLIWLGPYPQGSKYTTRWECPFGHQWETRYSHIAEGSNCPFCRRDAWRKKPNDYIQAAERFNLKWLGPEVKRVSKKTWWECPKGHKWEARYNTINEGHGCPHCYNDGRLIPIEDYYKLAQDRGFKWMGPTVPTILTKTEWECSEGHRWRAMFSAIKHNNTGCPTCNQSKGEARIREFLKSYGLTFEEQKRFSQCRYKIPLPFDFFIELSSKRILIEYDGALHFQESKFKDAAQKLKRTQLNDSIKDAFASTNGFHLIRIPYTENNVEDSLKRQMESITGQKLMVLYRDSSVSVLPCQLSFNF